MVLVDHSQPDYQKLAAAALDVFPLLWVPNRQEFRATQPKPGPGDY